MTVTPPAGYGRKAPPPTRWGLETLPRAPVGLTVAQPSQKATAPARRLRAGLAALVGSAEPSAADLTR